MIRTTLCVSREQPAERIETLPHIGFPARLVTPGEVLQHTAPRVELGPLADRAAQVGRVVCKRGT